MQSSPQGENNGFGPLLKRRGWNAKGASIVILAVFMIMIYFFETPSQEMHIWTFCFFACVFSLLAWILGEMCRRFCLFAEEVRHRESRYGGSVMKAFKTSFDFQNGQLVALMIFIAAPLASYALYNDELKSFNAQYAVLFWVNAIFIPIFAFLFGLREPSIVEYSQANENESKNLADGLAWSYYFGYLKFVLPALKTQINDTERFRYKIKVHKVFIIIPKDCYVFDKISESDPNGLVESIGNLAPLKKNRGGIQDRVYQHTVHRIKENESTKDDDAHYCVMEYATPLMTLYEMSEDTKAGLSREERDSQVNLFLSKLKAILDEDTKCKDTYQLVTLGRQDQDIGKIMISALKDEALDMTG